MTVDEMRERMSAQEWMHWRVFYARMAQQQQLRAMKG